MSVDEVASSFILRTRAFTIIVQDGEISLRVSCYIRSALMSKERYKYVSLLKNLFFCVRSPIYVLVVLCVYA